MRFETTFLSSHFYFLKYETVLVTTKLRPYSGLQHEGKYFTDHSEIKAFRVKDKIADLQISKSPIDPTQKSGEAL